MENKIIFDDSKLKLKWEPILKSLPEYTPEKFKFLAEFAEFYSQRFSIEKNNFNINTNYYDAILNSTLLPIILKSLVKTNFHLLEVSYENEIEMYLLNYINANTISISFLHETGLDPVAVFLRKIGDYLDEYLLSIDISNYSKIYLNDFLRIKNNPEIEFYFSTFTTFKLV